VSIAAEEQAPDLRAPPFFAVVEREARELWDTLDARPQLAGPWKQLFLQLQQSTRHVLSELLQNADDAKATKASAKIENGFFIFEHNGDDFDHGNFSSLCQFACSNKKNLHTIGFRGIGFKSVFSLGDPVHLTTPTLAVYFERTRFTFPIWDSRRAMTARTQIRVPIQDASRETELRKNFDEWAGSPASLLFFRYITTLEVNGKTISKSEPSAGPVPNSHWLELTGTSVNRVLVVRSAAEAFPDDAIAEIRQERGAADYSLPPCEVELVLGLPGEQRIYVVLPTEVRLRLSISCNAPFVQDPARTGIKSPSRSATNRWLLRRLGDLASETMHAWLSNQSLPVSDAVEAYKLLPNPLASDDTSDFSCSKHLIERYDTYFSSAPALLTTDRRLAPKGDCCVPPRSLYRVWSPDELASFLGSTTKNVLAYEVSESVRNVLTSWGWIKPIRTSAVLDRLKAQPRPPRPASWEKLAALWHFVESHSADDYDNSSRRASAIIPALGKSHLLPTNAVFRLPADRALQAPDDLEFLASRVERLDTGWVDFLAPFRKKDATPSAEMQAVLALLEKTTFHQPDSWQSLVSRASTTILATQPVMLNDVVRLAKIHAHLGCEARDCLKFANTGAVLIAPRQVLNDESGRLAELLPESWLASRCLHPSYSNTHGSCSDSTWHEWMSSPKSGTTSFPPINQLTLSLDRRECDLFLDRRGIAKSTTTAPRKFQNDYSSVDVTDFDFDDALVTHWQSKAKTDEGFWADWLKRVMAQPFDLWDSRCEAKVEQTSRGYAAAVVRGVPAKWVHRLRGTKCLPDTAGVLREPSELLLRNADTEMYNGVEPFVAHNLDTENTRSLLVVLGVRTRPSNPESLLRRIRLLATVNPPHVGEVTKWFGKIDVLLSRASGIDREEIVNAFKNEPLILTSDLKWTRSSNVFRKAGEDELPGLVYIYPGVADLRMWTEFGIAEQPTEDLMVDWVKSLPIGTVVDPQDQKRLRLYLKRFAMRIWKECGKWISIDDCWQPLTDFRFRVGPRQKSALDHLFPKYKAWTADLSQLPDAASHLGQDSLKDLVSVITPSVGGIPIDLTKGEIKPWILAFGQAMSKFSSDDAEQVARVREAASRMSRTVWLHVPELRTTPYIDGVPAGEPRTADCAWENFALLVRERSLAKYADAVVQQLARQFGNKLIADALRTCIEREPAFVEDYLLENFNLSGAIVAEDSAAVASPPEAAPTAIVPDASPNAASEKSQSDDDSDEDTDADANSSGYTSGSSERRPSSSSRGTSGGKHSYVGSRAPSLPRIAGPNRETRSSDPNKPTGGPTLMTEFAKLKGFKWNDAAKGYVRKDGCQIVPARGPFHWEWLDRNGAVTWRIWQAEQSLQSPVGVVCDTEVWEMLKRRPSGSAFVLRENKVPKFIAGSDLLRMYENKIVGLFPATYRLRQKSQSGS
jgi:hypothetical protein